MFFGDSVVQLTATWNLPLCFVFSLNLFSAVSSPNSDRCTCDDHKGNAMSPLRQLFGIPGHKLAFSPASLCPPLGLPHFSHISPLRSSSTCTRPLRETSVEQFILTALPHTTLPAPLIPQHHPFAPLYSQRKSPFPEAITLGTLRSGLKCDLWAWTGMDSAACVCAAAKSNTYGWAVWGTGFQCMELWGRKPPCFLCLPFDWKKSTFVFFHN